MCLPIYNSQYVMFQNNLIAFDYMFILFDDICIKDF
jgi:hypothetical protein